MGATSDSPVAPFVSSNSKAFLDSLFQRLPLFREPLEDSLAADMETVVVIIGRGALDLHFDILDIHDSFFENFLKI